MTQTPFTPAALGTHSLNPPDSAPIRAALWVLILVQTIMLLALLTQLAPHPPRAIVLFAMGPFLATAIAVCTAALVMAGRVWGHILAGVAALLALLSYGPQKYFDPAFAEIWPAVLAVQLAVLTIAVQIGKSLRLRQPNAIGSLG